MTERNLKLVTPRVETLAERRWRINAMRSPATARKPAPLIDHTLRSVVVTLDITTGDFVVSTAGPWSPAVEEKGRLLGNLHPETWPEILRAVLKSTGL